MQGQEEMTECMYPCVVVLLRKINMITSIRVKLCFSLHSCQHRLVHCFVSHKGSFCWFAHEWITKLSDPNMKCFLWCPLAWNTLLFWQEAVFLIQEISCVKLCPPSPPAYLEFLCPLLDYLGQKQKCCCMKRYFLALFRCVTLCVISNVGVCVCLSYSFVCDCILCFFTTKCQKVLLLFCL